MKKQSPVDKFVKMIAGILPMPDNDKLATEAMDDGTIPRLEKLRKALDYASTQNDTRLIPLLMSCFGPDDGFELLPHILHEIETYPILEYLDIILHHAEFGEGGQRKWSILMLCRIDANKYLKIFLAAAEDEKAIWQVRVEALNAILYTRYRSKLKLFTNMAKAADIRVSDFANRQLKELKAKRLRRLKKSHQRSGRGKG